MASPGKKHFALRIDPRLWAEVERLAAQDLRSANAEVEVLLREALARRGQPLPPAEHAPGAAAAAAVPLSSPATPPAAAPKDTDRRRDAAPPGTDGAGR